MRKMLPAFSPVITLRKVACGMADGTSHNGMGGGTSHNVVGGTSHNGMGGGTSHNVAGCRVQGLSMPSSWC